MKDTIGPIVVSEIEHTSNFSECQLSRKVLSFSYLFYEILKQNENFIPSWNSKILLYHSK